MLCDPKLSLLTGDEQQFDSYDDRPQHKLTEFRYLFAYLQFIYFEMLLDFFLT